jgi:hypothetical protein
MGWVFGNLYLNQPECLLFSKSAILAKVGGCKLANSCKKHRVFRVLYKLYLFPSFFNSCTYLRRLYKRCTHWFALLLSFFWIYRFKTVNFIALFLSTSGWKYWQLLFISVHRIFLSIKRWLFLSQDFVLRF